MDYDKLPLKFTSDYLKDDENSAYRGIDYDDELDSDTEYGQKYIEYFYQLNSMLKFSFRYYVKDKLISNIYIMDDVADNGWEDFYKLKILDKLITEFDIENNLFNFNFDFKKYIN